MSIPTNFLTATETQALLAEGTVATRQLVQDHQTRYEERDAAVQACYITISTELLLLLMQAKLRACRSMVL